MSIISYLKNIDWKTVNIFDILKGCNEAYFTDIETKSESYKSVVKYRLKVCGSCPVYNNGVCDPERTIKRVSDGKIVKGCGCNIRCKTALQHVECPAHKWKAVK